MTQTLQAVQKESALGKLRKAFGRIYIDKDYGFYGFVSQGLELKEQLGLGTLATDMKHLYYDPVVVDRWDFRELVAVVLHEIIHCVFVHPSELDKTRMGSRKESIWRMAQEYSVNIEVVAVTKYKTEGHQPMFWLPGTPVNLETLKKHYKTGKTLTNIHFYDPQFEGKTTEEIYAVLVSEIPEMTNPAGVEISPGEMLAPASSGGQSQGVSSAKGPASCPGNGSGALGTPEDACKCIKPQNSSSVVGDIVERILAAAEVYGGTGQGSLTNGIRRQIQALKKARVPWQRVLANRLGQIVNSDELSYARSDCRHGVIDEYILPGQMSIKPSDVVFAIDTSGSITEKFLDQCASELAGVLSVVEDVLILTSDCAVHEKVKAHDVRGMLKALQLKGGGGTDFRPVFDTLASLRTRPSVLVYFTDGYGTYPDRKPAYDVIWVQPTQSDPPPFGARILVQGF